MYKVLPVAVVYDFNQACGADLLGEPVIPRIIHQTWKTDAIPDDFRAFSITWRERNPGWEYRFWNDRDLLEFVASHYPELLELFCSYRHGVQRADAGRYMLLHHFGGVYADMDSECVQPLEPLVSEDRLILCQEPANPHSLAASCRGFREVLFNGVMASPAKHHFWPHLFQRMTDCRHASNVLDSTGPYLLTGAALSYPAPGQLRIEDANFFNPPDPSSQTDKMKCYAIHHLSGTWWEKHEPSWWRRRTAGLARRYYEVKSKFLGAPRLDSQTARAAVSPAAISAPLPEGKNIAILVPVRNASQHLPGFLSAVDKLDIPKTSLKLVFCEGDSHDHTYERLVQLTTPLKSSYRDIILLQQATGTNFNHSLRWLPSVQRCRRAGIAKVRNYLIDHGLNETDDWALWIDVDVCSFPADIIATLLAAKARIVVPDCVTKPGGPSYDHNNFNSTSTHRNHHYFRQIKDGLFQPPADYPFRLKLSDLRHSDQVPLDGVGGTMLLVDAALHRGGLRFPELPYDDLIETEAFGRLAGHCGITPVGLPRVHIHHVPW